MPEGKIGVGFRYTVDEESEARIITLSDIIDSIQKLKLSGDIMMITGSYPY
jgi:hypothetical protein